ncbi:hypothetical protein ACHAPJ_006659 [Fusarium lateritium]
MRCVALGRRGHGQSDWTGPENKGDIDYDILSRDVIDLLKKVNPGPFIFVAASMGTGETLLAYANSHYVKTHCKKDLDEGVATHMFAAFDPTMAEKNWAYLNDGRVADPYQEEVYPWATSEANAEMLWKLSEKLVGQVFDY